MAHDRFDKHHSFNVLGFIHLLYDTTCVNCDFWVKPVWGLGCLLSFYHVQLGWSSNMAESVWWSGLFFKILPQIVNYTSILVIIMSPFAVKSDPLSLYTLTWCHVTFLWHNWGHWDNLTSPCIHLIEPCWHTVNSCILGKIYGQNLSSHKSDPGP